MIWYWKDEAAAGADAAPEGWIERMAAALSAYLEAQAPVLLSDRTLVTAVPSRAPLMRTLVDLAAGRGWFSAELLETGRKTSAWFQHLAGSQAERLSRTACDWEVQTDLVRGREVLLLDDVFVTGTSLFSYANALKAAGAASVTGLAIVRHVSLSHSNYYDALRIVRRNGDWKWSPRRSVATRP